MINLTDEVTDFSYDCPYCGEPNQTFVDSMTVGHDFVEDCRVCCQPILLTVQIGGDGEFSEISITRENG